MYKEVNAEIQNSRYFFRYFKASCYSFFLLVPREILKDLDLGGTDDKDQDDSDYTGFIEEPRYVPPATMGPLLELSQPPPKLASTVKPLLGNYTIKMPDIHSLHFIFFFGSTQSVP